MNQQTKNEENNEIIWEALMKCMPKDAENLSTLLPDQKIRLLDKLIGIACEQTKNEESWQKESFEAGVKSVRERIKPKINEELKKQIGTTMSNSKRLKILNLLN